MVRKLSDFWVNYPYNCIYQQVAIVYILYSKRETEIRTAELKTINKAAFAYHFEYVLDAQVIWRKIRTAFSVWFIDFVI